MNIVFKSSYKTKPIFNLVISFSDSSFPLVASKSKKQKG